MSDVSARAALQIVGTVAGYYFGGPIGGAIGGSLGAYAGGVLFPFDPVYGPRLTELAVQNSSFGQAVAQVYGTMRVSGNLIWSTALRETRREEEVGKGGGGQEVVTYTYDADFAIAICEGPMAGLRRIWADSRLIYDVTSAADSGALQRSGETARYFTFYPGDEAQQPDATIEAALGAGQVPAYRGTCYIVFRTFQLADYGNRIPNFTFEVAQVGSPVLGRQLADQGGLQPIYENYDLGNTTAPRPIVMSIGGAVRVANTQNDDVTVHDLTGALLHTETRSYVAQRLPVFSDTGSAPWGIWSFSGWELYCDGTSLAFNAGARLWMQRAELVEIDITDVMPDATEVLHGVVPCADGLHFLVLTGSPVDTWYLCTWNGRDATLVDQGTVDAAGLAGGSRFGVGPVSQQNNVPGASMLESDLRHLWQFGNAGHLAVWTIDDAGELARTLYFDQATAPLKTTGLANAFAAVFADNATCAVVGTPGAGGESRVLLYSRLDNGAATPVQIGSVVNALAQRAGLTGGQLSTATLTETITGLALGKAETARSAIEALAGVFPFHCVESDGLLRFASRNGSVVAAIPADDLGAAGGDSRPDLVESQRAQETDLPARVTIRYRAAGADYQVGAQSARRASTGSRQQIELDLPLAISDAQAAAAAQTQLVERWVARNTRRFATTRKWAHLEAGDVVQAVTPTATYTVSLRSVRHAGAVVEFEGVDHAAASYSPNATAATVPGAAVLEGFAVTRLELLDIPLLRDGDDDAGLYAVAASYGSGRWGGAQISKQAASGGGFTPVKALFVRGTLGRALGALGNFTQGNRWDETNTVEVALTSGTLASASATAVYAGANAAWLGDELIQFRTATLVSGSTYRLSGLLRARKGTDRGLATHAAGERFVLLTDATVERVPVGLDEVGSTPVYRVATLGAPADTYQDRPLTHEGAAIKPLPPAHLQAIRAANDDLVLRWVRRGRIGQEWRDGVDVPLDETAESYDVEILDSLAATVLRTLSGVLPPQTYTAAQQAADFGAAPSNLNLRVYQRSERVGRGYPAAALLNAPFLPFLRDWNDLATTGQTLFGNSSPSHSAASGAYVITSGGGTAYSRLDAARSVADFDAALDVVLPGGGRIGLVYRTATFAGTNGMFAYAAYIAASGGGVNVILARGQNAAGGGAETTVQTVFVAGAASGPFRLRVRVVGSAHEIHVDGVLRVSATDATYLAPALPGLYGLAGSPAFDNLSISY